MTPAARKRVRRLTYMLQVRFTQAQGNELERIVDQADPPIGLSSLVRNIVGVWLINNAELQGAELERAIAELQELADEDVES